MATQPTPQSETMLDSPRWGTSLGVCLPARLARFDPARRGGQALPATGIGAERV